MLLGDRVRETLISSGYSQDLLPSVRKILGDIIPTAPIIYRTAPSALFAFYRCPFSGSVKAVVTSAIVRCRYRLLTVDLSALIALIDWAKEVKNILAPITRIEKKPSRLGFDEQGWYLISGHVHARFLSNHCLDLKIHQRGRQHPDAYCQLKPAALPFLTGMKASLSDIEAFFRS